MALRALCEAVQRLSLNGSTVPTLRGAAADIACVNWTKTHRSLLHTSCCQMRKLDSHAQPTYKQPSHKFGRWEPMKKMSEKYEMSLKPVPFPKTGGRGPNGRIWNHRRAGGHKRNFRMIDWVRGGPTEGAPLMEKVTAIKYDPNRSARLAVVANGVNVRYIIATENMKVGDLVKSSRVLSMTAVRASEGDSYPVGSLPIGTLVNNLEVYPGEGSLYARAAGVTAQLLRKVDDRCIIKLPSKREISVDATCVATVGRVSNVDHNKRVIGKAGRKRWLGYKPRSGRWHRKTGRFGRKINPPKPTKHYDAENKPRSRPIRLVPFSVSPV